MRAQTPTHPLLLHSLSELIMNIILQTIYYLLERKIRYGSQDKPQTTRMGESSFTLSLPLSVYDKRMTPDETLCVLAT